ncbi:hypothetical protein W97_07080 [Coniosporium apollinis CBS 100218]|uniref:Heterokaryon incompatibility domain-containing protein n=1 Tax=Coniosporium apollinis (strain CBS 100218) TaxID=1168221 RepID=R7Z0U1_CONA1|nr:uncharacterized protein W97_07080 [Coniosporium apollinis CBS 100218]EON67825.1 hypothetical protein W97_07080 [Coniosporium apollinis CBS 100218]
MPSFEAEQEEEGWETIAPGVRRRTVQSDKGLRIISEDRIETQDELSVGQIHALPDEEWAPIALRMNGARGLHRADALANARKRLRQFPRYMEYNSQLGYAISLESAEGLEDLLRGRSGGDGGRDVSGDANALDPNTAYAGQTALYHAVSSNKIQHARMLLDYGADPNIYSVYPNYDGDDLWQTPLHCAASDWRPDLVQLLIAHGANVNALSLLKGQTALHHAVLAARFWTLRRDWADLELVIRYLISAGVDVNVRDENLLAPLDIWMAIDTTHKDKDFRSISDLMLRAGADINAPGMGGNSSFLLSAESASLGGPSDLFRLLLEHGSPNVNQQNHDGDTALHLLVERGALDGVILAMNAGANPNIQGGNDETPLHRAAGRRGYHEIVEQLLVSADPTIQRTDGKTAIELALMAGGIKETMQAFMQHPTSRSFINTEKNALKVAALQSGTSSSRFDELVGDLSTDSSLANSPAGRTPRSQGSLPVLPAATDSSAASHPESAAFVKSVQAFEDLKTQAQQSEGVRTFPRRLVDINTGQIVPGDISMKYVIASYLWSPEKTPGVPQDSEAYEPIHETLQRIAEACRKYPNLIEMIPAPFEGAARLRWPSKDVYPSEPNPRYLSEVYWLVGREACRRGLHFIWIDSFCIDQKDERDKAEQIPFMADYYRNADCCVVVSESLRRRLRPEFDPSREFFDSGDSITDRLLGWTIGFHYNRVWVFQETKLAKEVITRAGDVRIKTTEVLRPEFPKEDPSANQLWLSAPRTYHEAPRDPRKRTEAAIGKAIQKLPLSGSRLVGNWPLSIDFCMILLRDRASGFQHDKIYGILGLFPASIRRAVPIDYKLPLSTVFAIFVYLRIQSGDLIALSLVRAPDHPPHGIPNAPSWLPSGYGFIYSDVLDLEFDPSLNFRREGADKIHLCMPFVRIADCYRLDDSVFGGDPAARHGNILLRFMDRHNALLPQIRRAAVEPVDPDYNLTSDENFGTGGAYIIRPSLEPTQISASEAAKVAEERERRRLVIQAAAREDRAVVALLGMEKRGSKASDFMLDTVWLVLCAEVSTGRWRREGIMVLDQVSVDRMANPDVREVQEFCIV